VCKEREPALASREKPGEAPHQSACFYVDEHPNADLVALARHKEPA
jgi:hypothetical protein